LTLDQDGVLRNARGMAVMSDGSAEITIPSDAKEVRIDSKGIISTEQGQIAQLMVVEFGNPQELNPAGNGLYETTAQAIPSEKTAVKQGYLEGSNVQSVVEMTRMIDVLREYQAVQNMMQSEHERMKGANQRLARTQA
jgi:flagellar basal-body rod protein FlgF